MARILFISDNFLNESLGIMYLSAYLKAKGHGVSLTLLSDHKDIAGLLRQVKKTNPDLIGFSVMTPQVNTFMAITKIIKQKTQARIIWGGSHCIFMSENVMESVDADIICIGEGEEPLLTLMDRLDSGADFSNIPGLWVRRPQEWIKNKIGYLEDNLDKYPFPDRELYYNKYPLLRNFSLKRLITQRGCPYDCSYCFEPTLKDLYKGKGPLVRRHSVRYVIEELREIKDNYPTKTIHFSDDTFNLNKNWVIDFLSEYKEKINLPFTCNILVLNNDEEVIRKLKESGCNGVVFGLESGIEKTRMEILNKKITDQQYLEASRLLHKYGLKFTTNIMLCLPNEDLNAAIKSIHFNARLKPFNARSAILKVYKGTKLAEFIIQKNLCEATGEFTYKAKSFNEDSEYIKKMIWLTYLFVKFPFLLPFARRILTHPLAQLLKPLIFLYYWQEIRFLKIPIHQSLRYFWHSRKIFMQGLGREQLDTYDKIQN